MLTNRNFEDNLNRKWFAYLNELVLLRSNLPEMEAC